jgi:hypothetical protein
MNGNAALTRPPLRILGRGLHRCNSKRQSTWQSSSTYCYISICITQSEVDLGVRGTLWGYGGHADHSVAKTFLPPSTAAYVFQAMPIDIVRCIGFLLCLGTLLLLIAVISPRNHPHDTSFLYATFFDAVIPPKPPSPRFSGFKRWSFLARTCHITN